MEKKTTVEPYGWINKDEKYNPNVTYSICGENIFWDVILSETIFVPVLLTGTELYEPESLKIDSNVQFVYKKVIIITDTVKIKNDGINK